MTKVHESTNLLLNLCTALKIDNPEDVTQLSVKAIRGKASNVAASGGCRTLVKNGTMKVNN